MQESFATIRWLDWLAVAVPTALAVAGACISFRPPGTRKKKWIAASTFSVLGLISIILVLLQLGETRVEGQRALDQATGGNAYCFFIPMQPGTDTQGEKWRLFAETNGQTFVPDVVAELRERSASTDSAEEINRKMNSPLRMNVGTVPKSGIFTDYSILPDAYQIDIYTRNDRFIETIAIYPNQEPNALHKWHGEIEIAHFPDGRLVRPRMSY